MSIFSIKNKKGERSDKMIGTYIDGDMYSYLALFTLSKQTNKSNLLRNLVRDWFDDTAKTVSRSQLLKDIADRVCEEWHKRIRKGHYGKKSKKNVIYTFTDEIRQDLKKRGICEKDVDKIMEIFLYAEETK